MNDPTDLEAALERSFESHSTRLGASAGDLGDVFARVERRRSRRRSIAAVGSVAAVGVGVLGILALGDRDESTPAASAGPEASVAADESLPARAAWRCHDQLNYWGETDEMYFASCEQTMIDGTVLVLDDPVPTTTSVGYVGTLAPFPATTLPPLGDPATSPAEQLYTVVAGDSLILIAQMFGVDPDVLVNYNSWPEGLSHTILVGDEVLIPPDALVPDGLDDRSYADPTTTSTTTTTTVAE